MCERAKLTWGENNVIYNTTEKKKKNNNCIFSNFQLSGT